MRNYGIGQLTPAEKSDILNQHKSLYDGYRTMQPEVAKEQPLYVFDPAGDKEGLVVNNKGEVKKYTNFGINEQVEQKEVCDECGAMMTEGICEQCSVSDMSEETGHLDDIYNQEDLNPDSGFDYIEGSSNDIDTFKKRHKNLYKEDDVIDDDGFEDEELETDELGEQGGNVDDMNVDSVEPAYDFVSGGPDDVYPVNEDDDMVEYETMESAWADDMEEQDVSGVQGIYGDMEPAYDFDSEGPGKAGPYQTSSYNEEEEMKEYYYFPTDSEEIEDEDDDEFMDYDGDDASTWPGNNFDNEPEWEEIDEDLMEDFQTQKNKISEMFNRMSRYN